MPTGFSSHGGGGHSSGGGSFGGFHRSSLIIIPSSRDGKAKPGTAWFVFFILSLFATIFLSVVLVSQYNFIKTRETDFVKFQTIAREGQHITGTVKDYDRGGEDKWYFTYTFRADNGDVGSGYSYALYDHYDVTVKYRPGKTFDLVAEQGEITYLTETVPADFVNMTLEDDGDYLAAQNSKLALWIATVISGGLTALCLTMGIIKVVKTPKEKPAGTSTQTIVDKTESKQTEDKQTEDKEEFKVCEYCGTYIPPKTMKRPNCGESQKK
ncbi:MAG: hypothetical protein MJ149_00725 [Clostridia bacterium]|nr:hypothetical protein [Clostridia bacterium]